MVNALWITLIGMGLVFLAILLLWGLMALLVRVTAEKENGNSVPEISTPEPSPEPEAAARPDIRQRVAAAAVAAALALQKQHSVARKPSHNGGGSASAWQAVHRAAGLHQRITSNRNR